MCCACACAVLEPVPKCRCRGCIERAKGAGGAPQVPTVLRQVPTWCGTDAALDWRQTQAIEIAQQRHRQARQHLDFFARHDDGQTSAAEREQRGRRLRGRQRNAHRLPPLPRPHA